MAIAVNLSPLFNGQTSASSGVLASGYQLFTYAAGSSTKQTTYTEHTGTTAQSNPIILNASGYPTNGPIWLADGQTYKFVLTGPNDTDPPASPVKTFDNISGVNDTAETTNQWVASGVAPTYISTTSFTLVGDQTTDFHVNRKLQLTVTAGPVYAEITASVYTTLTTVTVQMKSGQVLDSGLSAVNFSFLRNDNSALPGGIASSPSRVKGLLGAPTTATPLTKYDLSADEVVLRNANGGTVTRYLTGTITNDLGLAGPAINGRDQAAAFTAGSWVYLYFIWNGTTLATVSSAAVPTTGPALPTGYTHWAFATALRWNASSNIVPVLTKGSNLVYDLAAGGVNRILSVGAQTTFTAVSFAGFVPPNALMANCNFTLSLVHGTANVEFVAFGRPTGSAISGFVIADICTQVVANMSVTMNSMAVPLGTSQQIDYKLNAAPSTSGGLYIDVTGFRIPNGDA